MTQFVHEWISNDDMLWTFEFLMHAVIHWELWNEVWTYEQPLNNPVVSKVIHEAFHNLASSPLGRLALPQNVLFFQVYFRQANRQQQFYYRSCTLLYLNLVSSIRAQVAVWIFYTPGQSRHNKLRPKKSKKVFHFWGHFFFGPGSCLYLQENSLVSSEWAQT